MRCAALRTPELVPGVRDSRKKKRKRRIGSILACIERLASERVVELGLGAAPPELLARRFPCCVRRRSDDATLTASPPNRSSRYSDEAPARVGTLDRRRRKSPAKYYGGNSGASTQNYGAAATDLRASSSATRGIGIRKRNILWGSATELRQPCLRRDRHVRDRSETGCTALACPGSKYDYACVHTFSIDAVPMRGSALP